MSLRLRLLLAAGAASLVALVIADVATYSALRSSLYQRIDQDLQSSLLTTIPIGPHTPGALRPDGGGGPVGGGGAFVEGRAPDGVITIYSYGTEPGGKSYAPALPAHLATPASSQGLHSIDYLTTGSTAKGGPEFRVAISSRPGGGLQIVALPLDATTATLRQLLYIELAVTGAALAVALALGWWLVRLGLRPLVEMETTAEAIAEGALDARVPGDDRRTEIGRLARALNVMLSRIQRAFADRDATEAALRTSEERLRRFVSDASHELRTPLAAVSAYAELFARGAADRPADLERVFLGIRGESARMGRLVEDLLLLARLDEGRPLEHRPVELVELVAEAARAGAVVGPEWPVTLEAKSTVEVLGDRERLRQVIDNLLANVRAHTPSGTPSVVRISRDGNQAVVVVIDEGPGMTDDEAAHVFDRFYRADASRSRGTGGSGLGLSIVAALVDAHGGTVDAAARSEGGATFTVRLPIFLSRDTDEGDGRADWESARHVPGPADSADTFDATRASDRPWTPRSADEPRSATDSEA